jgi:hypothetical protein
VENELLREEGDDGKGRTELEASDAAPGVEIHEPSEVDKMDASDGQSSGLCTRRRMHSYHNWLRW